MRGRTAGCCEDAAAGECGPREGRRCRAGAFIGGRSTVLTDEGRPSSGPTSRDDAAPW